MKCKFTYLKIERSEHVETHASELLKKAGRLFDVSLNGHFTFSREKFHHRVSLSIKGRHTYFKAESHSENFYTAIEECVGKIERQLEKKKSKIQNRKEKYEAKKLNNLIDLEEYRRRREVRRRAG